MSAAEGVLLSAGFSTAEGQLGVRRSFRLSICLAFAKRERHRQPVNPFKAFELALMVGRILTADTRERANASRTDWGLPRSAGLATHHLAHYTEEITAQNLIRVLLTVAPLEQCGREKRHLRNIFETRRHAVD